MIPVIDILELMRITCLRISL